MPPLYGIFKGQVFNKKDFGVFIALPGYRTQGLVHISQIASHRVNSVQEEMGDKDQVYVKVINVEGGKLSLSMKVREKNSHFMYSMCYMLYINTPSFMYTLLLWRIRRWINKQVLI